MHQQARRFRQPATAWRRWLSFKTAPATKRDEGQALREEEMKTATLIAMAVLVVGSALASMNNACKKSQHSWCAPTSSVRHHIKS
jgi:hypothetical protein